MDEVRAILESGRRSSSAGAIGILQGGNLSNSGILGHRAAEVAYWRFTRLPAYCERQLRRIIYGWGSDGPWAKRARGNIWRRRCADLILER
jgi:hypothetical protein